MKFSLATILLVAASLVSAEDFRVVVGKAENGTAAVVYTPNQVKAKVGDRINFEFHVKNHTATQSSFAEPCTRQRNTATKELGVDSGFMPVPADAKEIPVWTIEVKQDSAPIWLFCNQGNHCNSGMVFAINAPDQGDKTFAAFLEKAKTAKHPDPALGQTADFTPPAAKSSAPPSGGGTPASTGSDSASAPAKSSAGASDPAAPASAPNNGASTPAAAAATTPATADQANAPSASAKPAGALSAARVPGAGIALTLAGLLAGMLL
jgi:hypothetical protein